MYFGSQPHIVNVYYSEMLTGLCHSSPSPVRAASGGVCRENEQEQTETGADQRQNTGVRLGCQATSLSLITFRLHLTLCHRHVHRSFFLSDHRRKGGRSGGSNSAGRAPHFQHHAMGGSALSDFESEDELQIDETPPPRRKAAGSSKKKLSGKFT